MSDWILAMKKRRYAILFALMLVLLVLPKVLDNEYILHLVILIMMWTILGASWNLLGGYTGQVSFGHSAFFGAGAYAACLLYTKAGVSLWYGFLFAGSVAAVISIPIGWICFRLRGPYFALSVLAFSEVLRLTILHWEKFTNGAVGILLIDSILEDKISYYYLVLGLALLVLGIIGYVLKTRMGFYFMAIREDHDAAEALGIFTTRYKLYALFISAFFTGVAGAFFANYTSYIDPYIVFSIGEVAIAMVLVVLLGGLGTFLGPVIGAMIVVFLSEGFRNFFGSASLLIYGVLLVIVIMFLPQGIVGTLRKRYRYWLFS